MKVLVAIPSSMKFGSQNTNGLALAAREISKSIHDKYGVEYVVAGEFSDIETWYEAAEFDLQSFRTHQEKLFKNIRAYIAENKIDMIHLHVNFYMLLKVAEKLPMKELGIPVVVTMHSPFIAGITANAYRDKINNSLNGVYLNYPGTIVHGHILDYYKNEVTDRDSVKYDVISNVPENYKYLGSEKENIIAIVSRIDAMKNPVWNLAKAIRDARESGYRVVFVGNTDILVENKQSLKMRDDTLKLIEENKDIVEHHNKMTRADIGLLLNRARILYHFSSFENQSLVPIEANASGCIAVGFIEVIPHVDSEVNRLVSRKADIWNRNFIKETEQVTPEEVRAFFDKEFDRDTIIDKWYSYYNWVLEQGLK